MIRIFHAPVPVPLRRRLLTLAWEAPCFGLALAALLRVNDARFGPREFAVVAEFLAVFAAFRLVIRPLAPEAATARYFLAVAGATACGAALLFAASPVRARWYRATVLEARLAEVVDGAPAAIVVADQDGRITAFNRPAEALLGYARAEVLGRDVALLAPPALRPALAAARRCAAADLRGRPAAWLRRDGPPLRLIGKGGRVVSARACVLGVRYGDQLDLFAILAPAGAPPRSP